MISTSVPTEVNQTTVTMANAMTLFLDHQQSPATRRAYAADLRSFFGEDPAPQADYRAVIDRVAIRSVASELLGALDVRA